MNDFFSMVQQMQANSKSRNATRVSGPGDGKSDSVPAVLKSKDGQASPAMLSEGEFIIKAEIVSNLGAGATNAGYTRLDELVSIIEGMDPRTAAAFADIMIQFGKKISSQVED